MIGSWFLKLAIWFAVIGVILFDAGAIVVNFVGLDNAAEEIAVTLSNAVNAAEIDSLAELEEEAESLTTAAGAKLAFFEIDAEGNINMKLKREADTLLVKRISLISKWGKSTVEAKASTGRVKPFG